MRTRIILIESILAVALVTTACGAGSAATSGHGKTKVVAAFYPLAYAAEQIGAALHRPAATERFVARLAAVDREYRHGLAHCARRDIITSHQAFGYLGQRYHLTQVAITGLSPETEATPQDLEHVIAVAKMQMPVVRPGHGKLLHLSIIKPLVL